MIDENNRGIDYLRISVTDKCNFRCVYCMPEEGIETLPHEEILSFEEIIKIVQSAALLGIRKIKLTGGEPLVRRDFTQLVSRIKQVEGIEEVTLTTNGYLLNRYLDELLEAGMDAINISLDSLHPERFKEITKVDGLKEVLTAIERAAKSSLKSVKINCLGIQNFNEDEIIHLAGLAKRLPVDVRFIELMPIGLGKTMKGLTKEQICEYIEQAYGTMKPYGGKRGNGPAKYWEVEGFEGKIGFISAVSDCFCANCNRIRLTANGFLKQCLHFKGGVDLKGLIRAGISEEALTKVIQDVIYHKPAHHQFGEAVAKSTEERVMAQIGG